jgi:hypothetical protein
VTFIDTRSGGVLSALTNHAAGRVRAAGYKQPITLDSGAGECWFATCTADDWAAVLIAGLDYQATHDTRIADWYLTSSCHAWICDRHDIPRVTPCGSPTYREAQPHTLCHCTCRGVNHGMGPAPELSVLVPLDWNSMPTPAWATTPQDVRRRLNRSHVDRFERHEFGRVMT